MSNPDFAPDEGITVVGGGAAGHATIAAYLDAGGAGPVTLLTADDRLPYRRPALTKELLRPDAPAGDLDLALGDDLYRDERVTVRLGARVRSVEPARQALTVDDGRVRYSRLVLATGSLPVRPPVRGADGDDVLVLGSLADTRRLLASVQASAHVAVVGDDLPGCELAAALALRGVPVTILIPDELPQLARFGRDAGELIAGWMRDAGVQVRGGATVASIDRVSAGALVHTADGIAVEAAHVVLATGRAPAVDLAGQLGLDVADGVPADAKMHTRVPGVVVAGEIARAMHVVAGRTVRIDGWDDATSMGSVAGHNLAGERDEWRQVPRRSTTIAGHVLEHVGWDDGYDEVRIRRSADGMTVWYGRDGRTVGVLTWGHADNRADAEAHVASGTTLPGA